MIIITMDTIIIIMTVNQAMVVTAVCVQFLTSGYGIGFSAPSLGQVVRQNNEEDVDDDNNIHFEDRVEEDDDQDDGGNDDDDDDQWLQHRLFSSES